MLLKIYSLTFVVYSIKSIVRTLYLYNTLIDLPLNIYSLTFVGNLKNKPFYTLLLIK